MTDRARLLVLCGEDQFSRHQALEELRASLGPREEVDANTTWLSGEEVTLERLHAVAATVPFLATVRLVVVEGLLGRFQPRAPARQAARLTPKERALGEWETLPRVVSQFPQTTTLVLVDGPLASTNPLLRALTPTAQVRRFPPLTGEALRRWVTQRAAHKGGTLTPRATSLLTDLVGSDLWTMGNELEKLLLYAGPRPVSDEDVQALVSRFREASVFAAVDAVLERRPSAALTLVHRLLADGTSVSTVLGMLARQNRLLLLTKDLVTRGIPTEELAPRLGVSADFVVRKCLEMAQRHTGATLLRFHQRILEADLAIKQGEVQEEVALELLVAEIGSTQSRRSANL